MLLALNLIINYFILAASGKFLHRKCKRLRLISGAAFGSLCSLIILLPPLDNMLTFIIKILISAAISLISFKFNTLRSFLINTAAFYLISFLFTGIMLAVWFIFTPNDMLINNSSLYINIHPIYLILSAVITYFAVRAVCRITGRKKPKKLYVELRIENASSGVELKGKLDTGCELVEPFSGSPVIICALSRLMPIAPPGVIEYFKRPASIGEENKLRLAPFSSLGGSGLLPCFLPDRVFADGRLCNNEIYIAATEDARVCGDADCLINPQCLD